jgi:hypothetical protein
MMKILPHNIEARSHAMKFSDFPIESMIDKANKLVIGLLEQTASAKILQECKNKHAGSELAAINSVLDELKSGYLCSSKSFDFYSLNIQAKIEHDKRYQTV